MIPRILRITAAVLLCLAAALAFLLADAPSTDGWTVRRVLVPKGSSVPQIIGRLSAAGVLRHPRVFQALVIASRTGRQLQFGEYSFPVPPSTFVLWRMLVEGEGTRREVTVPEGSTIYEVDRILAEGELLEPGEFVEAATSPGVVRRLGLEGPTAEGFLFPETYSVVKSTSADEFVEIMVREFRKRFTRDLERMAADEGLSLREVVTIASIIEKETGVEEEKALVSAIIRKRLALRMPLQMDPTVIYGLRSFGEPLTKKDLRSPHPYNSYLNKGLPPGPIANPGLSSLKAALMPADADYLYFASRNDGSHRFSRTLEEHNRAVALLRKSEQEDQKD